MINNEISDKKIAILIDAENVSEKYVKYILDEIANYGLPTYKRVYGDWSNESLKKWKSILLTYAITPVQQYSYTTGKNASDSALIIDAMDILYTGNVQGFCIVSSDSDFTRLATRLREAGKTVIGMGEKKTPKALISACEKFVYLEVLLPREEKPKKPVRQDKSDKPRSVKEQRPAPIREQPVAPEITAVEQPAAEPAALDIPIPIVAPEDSEQHVGGDVEDIVNAIRLIIAEFSNEDGLASLSDIGNALTRRFPEFDSRNYGFSKFSQFMNSLNGFEVLKQRDARSGIIQMYVKIKV